VNLNCTIPLPVRLNCWKHHLKFIRAQIKKGRKEHPSANKLKELLLVIGESQMDLYLGTLSPRSIATEITDKLSKTGADSRELFLKWLYDSGKNYKLLILSDNSVWTVRAGKDAKRYVHIHPGRQSPETMRVKALTLKTAILTAIIAGENDVLNIDLINNLRVNLLDVSPLKSISASSGLGKFINILMEEGGV